jgi:feruloyl esterase
MVDAKYCRVEGHDLAGSELRITACPHSGTSKLLMVGNGGLAGTINTGRMTAPLGRGYAVVSTDTGHVADTDGHWAQGHMQRVIDFAHRSVHVTAEAVERQSCSRTMVARRRTHISLAARRAGSRR